MLQNLKFRERFLFKIKMHINKLKEKLDIKIQQEYDKFIEKLMKLSPKEIIESSYEKIFKEEFISMIQGKELSKSEINRLFI